MSDLREAYTTDLERHIKKQLVRTHGQSRRERNLPSEPKPTTNPAPAPFQLFRAFNNTASNSKRRGELQIPPKSSSAQTP